MVKLAFNMLQFLSVFLGEGVGKMLLYQATPISDEVENDKPQDIRQDIKHS